MEPTLFTDFDAFADSVRGVDAVMMLQHLDRRCWTVEHADLPEIHVQSGQLGSGNIVEGRSSPEGYLLYLPLTETCKYSANGIVVPKGSFMILEPGCEFCVSTQFEHDWCMVQLPIRKLSGSRGSRASSDNENRSCRVSGVDHRLTGRFSHIVCQTLAASSRDSQFKDSLAATVAAEELLKVVSMVVGRPPAVPPVRAGAPRLPRDQIIRKCREVIEESEDAHVRVNDMVAATNTSERTLRRVFHDYYGTGPKVYLQSRQLHQVHRALKAAEPDAQTVTEVLFENGVWELGRFASRYRQFFGELPSETLRRRRR